MSQNFNNMFQGNQQYNPNQEQFPAFGGQPQPQQPWGQQPVQQPVYGQPQQPMYGQPQAYAPPGQQFYVQQPVQQQAFPGFQAPPPVPVAPAATAGAPAANPFAGSNPFGGGGFKPKEFKPKDPHAIMDEDDDAPLDFGASKKKKKTAEELAAEKAKAEAEAVAMMPTKGKPSDFFVMDFVEGDQTDETGGQRVPNAEQKVFIFSNYPTYSAPSAMIKKIYELWQIAKQDELAREAAANAYKKPKAAGQRQEVELEEEVVLLDDDDTTFGAPVGKQNKKTAKKAVAQQQEARESKKVVVKKTKEKTDAQAEQASKKVSLAIKDINVVPGEDIKDVDENRTPASFVFIGHVDAGKSTICGNLAYMMGEVDSRTIEKFKKEAKDKGRDSWWLAYVMDSSDEEKAKGKTVEMGRAVVTTPTKSLTIFDAPGHKNYVPNMIMGATLADFGGLVISARKGEFEAGFQQDGQTREHIQLARSLGITHLVIVVNKMDEATVSWKRQRYDDIRENLTPFLKNCGFREEDLYWVPISGLTGANIVEPVSDSICSWYSGPTLLHILDNMPIEARNAEAPLRIPVLDKMKDSNRSVIFGKVEQGTVRLGDRLALAPQNLPCQVLNIMNDKNDQVMYARPGDNVQLKISYLEEDQIFKGDVLCPRDNPMASSQVLECEVELLELLKPIFSKGSQCMMHIHTYADEVQIKDIKWAIEKDPNTGVETRKEMPKFTRSFAKCLVRIGTKTAIPVEKIDVCGALGRFTLRDEGKTIAVGRVSRFIPFNKDKVSRSAAEVASTQEIKSAGPDKVAPVVFNMESGETETPAQAMESIAEERD